MTKEDEEKLVNTMSLVVDKLEAIEIAHSKTPWGVLASWAGIIILMASGASALTLTPLWNSMAENKALDIRQQIQIDNTRIQLAKLEAIKEH